MDRASILGDAIEYLKELLQRINDIHKELEAAKLEQSRSMPTSPVGGRTPRPTQGYPAAVKEECPVLPNPESQPPRVRLSHHFHLPRFPNCIESQEFSVLYLLNSKRKPFQMAITYEFLILL